VQDTLPFRYRGILEVDLEICTACLACERACPIDCIVIDAEKDKAAGGLVMTRFDIDMAKCMYCGLCSEPCPTGAIHPHARVRGRRLLAREPRPPLREGADDRRTARRRPARPIRRSSRSSTAVCATSPSSRRAARPDLAANNSRKNIPEGVREPLAQDADGIKADANTLKGQLSCAASS
jgi:ferredoxin